MDTNAGRFVEEENAEKWMKRLAVGEVVKIKNEELIVVAIGPDAERGLSDREVILALKSEEDRIMSEFASSESLEKRRTELQREFPKHGKRFIGEGKPPGDF